MSERGFFSASDDIKTLDGNIFSGFPWLTTHLDGNLSWPPTCLAMYEVMRSFGAIKTKTHLLFAFDARFRVCTLFGPRVRNVNTAYSRDVFKESEARKT